MVRSGTACLRRIADGRRRVEVQFHRLLHNRKVTTERIIDGWSAPTLPACAGRHVLAIQDTGALSFRTTPGRRRSLGAIGRGVGRGILLHPAIAVDAGTGDCPGLLGGRVWTRPDAAPVPRSAEGRKRKTHRQVAFAERDSSRWVEVAEEVRDRLAGVSTVTLIADREADMYPPWATVPCAGVHVLGRAYHDRPVVGGGRLSTAAAAWPRGTRRIALREREDRDGRTAEVALRWGTVTIARPPSIRTGEDLPERVTLTLLEVSEPSPPEGAEPVLWRLPTTHGVADADAGWRVADWYRRRWVIEQLFRTLKTQGLRIEDSQIDDAEHLVKLVAVACRAVVVTLQLVQARDGASEMPAAAVFDDDERAVLDRLARSYAHATGRHGNPHPPDGLPPWAAWIVARLGGWDGHPASRPPGPITFKTGLDKLKTMAVGWALRDV